MARGDDARWRTRAHVHSVSGEVPILNVSFKPQTISPKFKVRLTIFLLNWQRGTLFLWSSV